MMHLAERTEDSVTAEKAILQIETALETMRAGGRADFADYYALRLTDARRARFWLQFPI
jgi:hypothetical protein